jgi:hypothetical protein
MRNFSLARFLQPEDLSNGRLGIWHIQKDSRIIKHRFRFDFPYVVGNHKWRSHYESLWVGLWGAQRATPALRGDDCLYRLLYVMYTLVRGVQVVRGWLPSLPSISTALANINFRVQDAACTEYVR